MREYSDPVEDSIQPRRNSSGSSSSDNTQLDPRILLLIKVRMTNGALFDPVKCSIGLVTTPYINCEAFDIESVDSHSIKIRADHVSVCCMCITEYRAFLDMYCISRYGFI